ncbi:MAG: hypothetical protein WC010_03165 [Candidatus Absconditabacterales bacterium]
MKKHDQYPFKGMKCDVVVNILKGSNEINNIKVRHSNESGKPSILSKKLAMVIKNSGCKVTKAKAERAIVLLLELQELKNDTRITDSEMQKILKTLDTPIETEVQEENS